MKPSKLWIERLRHLVAVPAQLQGIRESLGRIESTLNAARPALPLRDYEFKVYSQWGEDGIIDQLVSRIEIPRKIFVEFGVETYIEANTLYLLKHRHWRGLVIDGSTAHIDAIRRSETYWKYELRAECSFITAENINDLIAKGGVEGDIGLLSVDIDGNDYWVWRAIEVVSPRIVVCEYNSLFGATAKVTIPYQPDFLRRNAHASNGYFGASIGAVTELARVKGYSLVAGNSAGNNLFFVRNDCLGPCRAISPQEAYVQSDFREARSAGGDVELLSFEERQSAVAGLPVIDVETGATAPIQNFL